MVFCFNLITLRANPVVLGFFWNLVLNLLDLPWWQINVYNFNFNFNFLLSNTLNWLHPVFLYVIFFSSTYLVLVGCQFMIISRKNSFMNVFYLIFWLRFFLNFVWLIIFLGAWWAFQEGTWGGWWAWDSSEFLSLFNFFFFTFFIHFRCNYKDLFYFIVIKFSFVSIYFTFFFCNKLVFLVNFHVFFSNVTAGFWVYNQLLFLLFVTLLGLWLAVLTQAPSVLIRAIDTLHYYCHLSVFFWVVIYIYIYIYKTFIVSMSFSISFFILSLCFGCFILLLFYLVNWNYLVRLHFFVIIAFLSLLFESFNAVICTWLESNYCMFFSYVDSFLSYYYNTVHLNSFFVNYLNTVRFFFWSFTFLYDFSSLIGSNLLILNYLQTSLFSVFYEDFLFCLFTVYWLLLVLRWAFETIIID